MNRLFKNRINKHIKRTTLTGKRIYIAGFSVNEVKRAIGNKAKKIRLAGNGEVEIIHTYNGTSREFYAFISIVEALQKQATFIVPRKL